MTTATTTRTPDELRAQAAAEDRKALESFERCDTDGALSQWAAGLTAAELRLQASIDENGGRSLFPALFDAETGEQVPAKLMQSKRRNGGVYWALLNERGWTTGVWFTPSKAQDARKARAADTAKGYYIGYVMARAQAEIRGGSLTSCSAIAVRTDDGYSDDVEIVDNGQHDEYTWELGRWYAVQGGLIW